MLIKRKTFSPAQMYELNHAIEIAEDIIGDRFGISTSQWKRYRYDIRSLKDLKEHEIVDSAYAQILKYARHPDLRTTGSEKGEYFKICLQDHVILRTIDNHPELKLLSFMVYVVTHELLHVVRFARFLQSFYASENERIKEEALVHRLTHELLRHLKLPGMHETLNFFSEKVQVETFKGGGIQR